jgi:S-(hydroxymethyl)glutathione dehydrogenase/alcohol dehydrogenase
MEFIKTRAAVAWAPNEPLKIEELDLMPPQKGEVLVRIVATGVCHTDAYTLPAKTAKACFPACSAMKARALSKRLAKV